MSITSRKSSEQDEGKGKSYGRCNWQHEHSVLRRMSDLRKELDWHGDTYTRLDKLVSPQLKSCCTVALRLSPLGPPLRSARDTPIGMLWNDNKLIPVQIPPSSPRSVRHAYRPSCPEIPFARKPLLRIWLNTAI
ncbi:hypothetical protein MRB53_041902 [Persea americana]|nr:hypothetical protein MRB53_041902 [Persea americana]